MVNVDLRRASAARASSRRPDILADAAFRAGRDVKKAEVHGMSQRGGSVTSDVRFGREVLSPMVPPRRGRLPRRPLAPPRSR